MTTATLRLRWNVVAKNVDFQMNADPGQSLSYTRDDSNPPRNFVPALDVSGFAANCTVGRQFADITASFGNVFVDP